MLMECAIAPEVTGSQGMKTEALKLVRGISTSHYLVVSMHLACLGELQSPIRHEYKPQSWYVEHETMLILKQIE